MVRLADLQDGVVSWEQLAALGYTSRQIRSRVRQGRLFAQHHNVYAVARRRITPRAHLRAALLSIGPAAFLSHRSAAAIHGLRAINSRAIELTVPGGSARRRSGLTIHRTATEPHADEVRSTADGLRTSSVPRLLIELAPREPAAELNRLITVAVQKRLLRLDAGDGRAALEAALARHRRRPGMAALKTVLAAYRRPASAASDLERAFDRLLAQHPELPAPVHNVSIDHWEIDRFWPAHRVAVELDGRPYHVAAAAMERDRIKDVALQRLGCRPLRFTDHRVEHDSAGIFRDLRHFLVEPG